MTWPRHNNTHLHGKKRERDKDNLADGKKEANFCYFAICHIVTAMRADPADVWGLSPFLSYSSANSFTDRSQGVRA